MVRVLQVYPQLNNAGTERVILNLYENMDSSLVQFDFLVERAGELDDKVRQMGGKVYYLYTDRKKDYYFALLAFFHEHPEYRIVHTHTHARMGLVLKASKRCNIPCRIAHSHNARNDLPKVVAFVKGLRSIPMEKYANHFFACSFNAAKWLFPHKIKECKVIYNGIALEDYLFDIENRKKARKKLKISNGTFVMIYVGRFAREKNHEYLVRILRNYRKIDTSDWKMLLVGDGPLEGYIKEQVVKNDLKEHVLFLGSRKDVSELYCAADMFIFPSLHEGLGIVAIEAQTSGLPCIVSDAIPPEADMEVGLLHTLSLKESTRVWAEAISANRQDAEKRETYRTKILRSKYNIQLIAAQMQKFYLENGK